MVEYVTAQSLSEIIGDKAAITLLDKKGGGRIYIPAHLSDDHYLIALIGRKAAVALVDHISINGSGDEIELPMGSTGREKLYRRERDRLLKAGISNSKIARQLGVTDRTVRRARQRDRVVDTKQGRLF